MFSIDGVQWAYPCAIERISEVRPSPVSGTMLDGSYFNDVLGTYLQYNVTVAVPIDHRDDLSRLYEYLNDPVDGHAFLLPYNQGTVRVTGRVRSISDVYVRLPGGGQYWKGLRFTLTANHPTKAISLSEAIQRGRATLPEIATPEEGDAYTWMSGHWVKSGEYRNGDRIYY